MLFRSRHETGLRVTTWGLRLQLNEGVEGQKGGHDQLLRLQHEAEPNEVPARKFKLRPPFLVKDLKGGRDQSFRSRPEETLRSKNVGHNYV